jgi:preprotein translocase SecE subunit
MNNFLGRIRKFLNETMAELRKCTWPKRGELFESTILVIVVIVVLTTFAFLVDQLSIFFINLITGIQ